MKHKSLVYYLNACLLLYRCHFLVFQYSKRFDVYSFLSAKLFSHHLLTSKCNPLVATLHSKLRLTGITKRRKRSCIRAGRAGTWNRGSPHCRNVPSKMPKTPGKLWSCHQTRNSSWAVFQNKDCGTT